MARKVNWAYEAATDLEALAEYIARDSAFYASAFVQEIRDASRSLNEFSERGRIASFYTAIFNFFSFRIIISGFLFSLGMDNPFSFHSHLPICHSLTNGNPSFFFFLTN